MNLRNSFPEKSEVEIKKIAEGFYHFLCDLIVENIKSITISEKEIRKRCHVDDYTLIQRLYGEKRSAIGVLGHYGNWEWANPFFSLAQPYPLFVIYKKLSNSYFDKMMYRLRSKFGTKLIEMNDVVKVMFKNKDLVSATIFVGDQTPFPNEAYWTRFLNQDTPVFRGTEIIAKKFNLPVVYVTVKRERRGYYAIQTELLCENPKETAEGEISELHTKKLERDIRESPEFWLWSHRRWKHKKP
jgi:KDO2-lipid IV(A) lauroyltransferase